MPKSRKSHKSHKSRKTTTTREPELTAADQRIARLAELEGALGQMGITDQEQLMIHDEIKQLEQEGRDEEEQLARYNAALGEIQKQEAAEQHEKEKQKQQEDARIMGLITELESSMSGLTSKDRRKIKRDQEMAFSAMQTKIAAISARAEKKAPVKLTGQAAKKYQDQLRAALSESSRTVADVGSKLSHSLSSLNSSRGIYVIRDKSRPHKNDYIIDVEIPEFGGMGPVNYITPAPNSHFHVWRNDDGGIGAGIRFHFNIKGVAEVFSIEVDYNSRKSENQVINVSERVDGNSVRAWTTGLPVSNSAFSSNKQATAVVNGLRERNLIPKSINVNEVSSQLSPYIETVALLYYFALSAVENRKPPTAKGRTRKKHRRRKTRRHRRTHTHKTRRKSNSKNRDIKTKRR